MPKGDRGRVLWPDYGLHFSVLAICVHLDPLGLGWVWHALFWLTAFILALEALSSVLGLMSKVCGWVLKRYG